MGNHGELFRTVDGTVFEVVGSYEYLYAYYPQVTICPGRGKMMVDGKTIGITAVQPASRKAAPPAAKRSGETKQERSQAAMALIKIVLRTQGCDYFVADGPRGYYLLEWYGGHDPDRGDGILEEVSGYGFKNVLYDGGQEGKVYVDNYMLSKDSVLEKLGEKCK